MVEATQQSAWKMRNGWDAKLQIAMNADVCKASMPAFRVYDRCCRIMKAKNWARYVLWRTQIYYLYIDNPVRWWRWLGDRLTGAGFWFRRNFMQTSRFGSVHQCLQISDETKYASSLYSTMPSQWKPRAFWLPICHCDCIAPNWLGLVWCKRIVVLRKVRT